MSDGFLARWSRRKLDAKQGKVAQPQPPQDVPVAKQAEIAIAQTQPSAQRPAQSVPEPSPTLEDAKALTSQSDFTRFTAPNVASEVRNAALKKLFADPRFNVMDGLDIYIDDYTQPDPMPHSMLRQLAGAKFLGLFRGEEDQQATAGTRDVADDSQQQIVAKSIPTSQTLPAPDTAQPENADPDLRLQQDHATAGKDPGRGAA